jgi:hypothetical protein
LATWPQTAASVTTGQELRQAETERKALQGVRWPKIPAALSIHDVADYAGQMVEATTGVPTNLLAIYDRFYRASSFLDIHGLGPIDRHVDHTDSGLTLKESVSWLGPTKTLLVAATYLTTFAHPLVEAFGISTNDIEVAQTHLVELADAIRETLPTLDELAEKYATKES